MNPTPEQIELYSTYSDVYKDIYNIRPRWVRPEDHTPKKWGEMIDDLLKEIGPDPNTAWYDTSAELD